MGCLALPLTQLQVINRGGNLCYHGEQQLQKKKKKGETYIPLGAVE